MILIILVTSLLYIVPGHGTKLILEGRGLGEWALPFFIISPILLSLWVYLFHSFYKRCKQTKEERTPSRYGRLTIGVMMTLSIFFFVVGFFADF